MSASTSPDESGRQKVAPGERVPMYRDERSPGITFPELQSPRSGRQNIAPLQGAESCLTGCRGGVPMNRDWLSSTTNDAESKLVLFSQH